MFATMRSCAATSDQPKRGHPKVSQILQVSLKPNLGAKFTLTSGSHTLNPEPCILLAHSALII